MIYGSLFAGVGGIDLGLEAAGMECAWQVEIDPACRAVLERHWPRARRYDDVRTVHGHGFCDGFGHRTFSQCVAGCLPAVDLVCGGFPCQDVSVAGRRAGLDGERSGLWFEFRRVIAEVAPRWVLIENVPGLLSSNDGRDFAVVVRGLMELGYGVAWRVLDAQHFGVAQRRRRVFVVGHLGEPWSAPAAVLFEPESCDGDSPPRRTPGTVVARSVTGSPGGASGKEQQHTFVGWQPEVSHALSARDAKGAKGAADAQADVIAFRPTDGLDMTTYDDLSPTIKVGTGIGIPSGPAVFHTTGAGWWNRGPGSLRAQGGGTDQSGHVLIDDTKVRRLTPLECERLMGWPDGHTAGHNDSTRYRMCGNGVASPVAAWIARRIVALAGHTVEGTP